VSRPSPARYRDGGLNRPSHHPYSLRVNCDAQPVFTGGDDGDGILEPSETWVFTCTKFVESCSNTNGFNLITNFATSSTTVAVGNKTVDDETSNNVTVACIIASTELTKTSDRTFVNLNETILYTIFEKNTGNVNLNPPQVVDDNCDAQPVFTGGDDSDGIFEPSETWVFTCTKFVESCPAEPFITNTATSSTTAADPFGNRTVENETSNDVTVECVTASTELTKTSDRTFVNLNETILYTIFEKNTGNVDLNPPIVVDDNCDAQPVFTGGDDSDGIFEPSETWIFECTKFVESCPTEPFITNTATSSTTAADPFGNRTVENETSNDVIVACIVPPLPGTADDTAKTKVNTPVTIKVLKNDWGVEHISSVETPTLNGGIVVTNPDGTLTYIPLPNFVGTDSFTYTVHYTEGGYGYADVTVTVTDKDNSDKSDKSHKKKDKKKGR